MLQIIYPIAGRNPIQKNYNNMGTPQQGPENEYSIYGPKGFVQLGNWVCEEIKMRYDFTQV